MRIACLHIPQFALQCAIRLDRSARGAPIVVAGVPELRRAASCPGPAPIVLACSRAAWALGARVGMTATAARALSPELVVLAGNPTAERETVRALADVLLGLSPVVDVGGRTVGGAHLAMYCEVPSKTRGSTFGERVLERLALLGLSGRVGIADDRFTAWVAASSHDEGQPRGIDEPGVVSVPRGGSAAYLAPRPLSLLAISPEVQHMLEALGVATLGAFAALPAPSVARPFEADYQALARGESGHALRPYSPEAPIREEVAIAGAGIAAALVTLAERIAARLEGRGRAAARLEVVASGKSGERTIAIEPLVAGGGVLGTAEAIAEAISEQLGEASELWRLRATVIGEALAPGEHPVEALTAPTAEASIVDTLSLVLSTTGGSLDLAFGPGAALARTPGPAASRERRQHRRMRRGKERRRVEAFVQPKLFKL